jgi:hypothetical protein
MILDLAMERSALFKLPISRFADPVCTAHKHHPARAIFEK